MNIKGKTIIELTDAKTGKLVQRTEDDNMLTNALSLFYKQGGITNPTAFNNNLRSDALQYLLGGVFCLDTALTESADVVRVPKGVTMIANGVRDVLNSGNPTEMGSWNETESGWQQDGSYKMVYDWTTSQGNGTIACVCLTSKYYGYEGIGNKSLTRKTTNPLSPSTYNAITGKAVSGTIVGYKDNVVYTIADNFVNKTAVTLKKYKLPVTEIDIRNTMSAELIEEKTLNLPSNLQNLSTYANYDISETYVKGNTGYILVTPQEGYDNRRIAIGYVLVFDASTEAFTNSYVVDLTSVSERVNMTGISDKYVVLGLTWVEYANQANSGDITDGSGFYDNTASIDHTYLETIDTDRFVGARNGNAGIIDVSESELLPLNGQNQLSAVGGFLTANNLFKVATNEGSSAYIYRDARYIATINNLETPVTKDGSKTMKVTYVLRFS